MAKICVFCSSSENGISENYKQIAKQTGELLGKSDHHLIYGGSHRGLMGIVSQAFAEYNGNRERITEVIPEWWSNLIIENKNAIITKDMYERMKKMQEISDAFITLPGGFGTIQETMDVLVAKQLKQHKKPLAIINTCGFYNNLTFQIYQMIEQNFAPKDNHQLFYLTETPQQALDYIRDYQEPNIKDKCET